MIWLLVVILAAGLLLFAVMSRTTQPTGRRRQARALDYDMVRHRWGEIERATKAGGLGLKGAVSEADKLLDYVMRQQGYRGTTMAERLKQAQTSLSDREAVWRAHKLRNHLAHEAGFESGQSQARAAINAFGRALRDLGALK